MSPARSNSSDEAPATEADVHSMARAMPFVKPWDESSDHAVYQVGGKSFVFFRTPRADAVDPGTGERYDDVVVIWVPDEGEKQALVQGPGPFFTTPHFDGHLSVLVRISRLGEVTRGELRELVEAAWLSRASRRRGEAWLRGRD